MFKKTLYMLFVLVLLIGCTPKALTKTPTVVHEQYSPIPVAKTATPPPLEITDLCTLSGKVVDLISYQKTKDNKLSLIMRERDSGSLVTVTTAVFMYTPLAIKNGITYPKSSAETLTYFDADTGTKLTDGKVDFPRNSSGTVRCRVGEKLSIFSVTGLFSPTEKDLYIQSLVDTYQANRNAKAEMLGARALHNASYADPSDDNLYYSVFEMSQGDWFFSIPESQCWTLTQAYKEWGTDWKQYVALRQMCGLRDSPDLSLGFNDPYAGLAIDNTNFGNKAFLDFNRYYSYAGRILPDVFDPSHSLGEICRGGQVNLPNGMTGTAYESTGWVDYDGGFVFDHGIDFVVSVGEQHFFIPYGGYFVVTDSAHTPDEYALYTTCSEN